MKDNIIIKEYLKGISLEIIATKAKCSRYKIKTILENNKISLRKRSIRSDSFNNKKALLEFNKGKSIKEISIKYKISENALRNYLKNNDKKLISSSDQLRIVKENPFKMDCKNSKYWIGMICADGTIEKSGKKTKPRVALFSKDYNTLKQFKEFLGYNVNINLQINKLYKTKLYNIKFSQPNTISFFNKMNLKSNKSLDLNPNINLCWNFIRGVFDGDGCIWFNNKGQKYVNITTGSLKFANKILQFLLDHKLKAKLQIENKNNKNILYKVIIFNKKDIKLFYNFIYKDAKYFMLRKKKKFNKYFNDNGNGEQLNTLCKAEDMV